MYLINEEDYPTIINDYLDNCFEERPQQYKLWRGAFGYELIINLGGNVSHYFAETASDCETAIYYNPDCLDYSDRDSILLGICACKRGRSRFLTSSQMNLYTIDQVFDRLSYKLGRTDFDIVDVVDAMIDEVHATTDRFEDLNAIIDWMCSNHIYPFDKVNRVKWLN